MQQEKFLNDNIDHSVISKMTAPQLRALCKELRGCILRTVMKNGGHLASNLGTVELTVALHYVYDVGGNDRILWDVGHQAYAHKLLTGRYSRFSTLRCRDGISGFCRRGESPADAFISGHSSTSVSAAYGISTAMRLKGEGGSVAAVIGDGALTGGMAYEGLNNAGKTATNLTLVLNDNAMSISKSAGALSCAYPLHEAVLCREGAFSERPYFRAACRKAAGKSGALRKKYAQGRSVRHKQPL